MSFATGTKASPLFSNKSDDDIAGHLHKSEAIVEISHAPTWHQSSALLSAAHMHLTIKPLDGHLLHKLVKACLVGRAPRKLPDGLASELDFVQILCAFRRGVRVGDVLAKLRRATASQSRVSPATKRRRSTRP